MGNYERQEGEYCMLKCDKIIAIGCLKWCELFGFNKGLERWLFKFNQKSLTWRGITFILN